MISIEFDEKDVERIIKRLEYETIESDSFSGINEFHKALARVERSAKEKAPKDTGALRRSITSAIEREGNELVGYVFTPLEYAPYVEYGTGLFAESGGRKDVPWNYQDDNGEWHSTSGQHPQPFMRPALQENREAILKVIKQGLFKSAQEEAWNSYARLD